MKTALIKRNLLLTTAAIILASNPLYAQSWLTNGLVAYYPFCGSAQDASGNGRHGTVHGATPIEDHASVPGAAYHLNGTNDYIYFGRILPDMQTFTITAWVRSYGGGTFLCDSDWEIAKDFYIQLRTQDSHVRCDKPGFSTFAYLPWKTPVEGVWRHMAWVIKGSGIRLYVDGFLSGTSALGGADVGYPNFIIGTMEYPKGSVGWGGYWRGDLSELRIYDRALTDYEVAVISGCMEEPRLDIRVSQVEIGWQSATNLWYQAQYRSTMTTNQWVPLSSWVAGDGARLCATDEVILGSPQKFYRVTVTNQPPQNNL